MTFKKFSESFYSKLNFKLSNFNLALVLLSLFFCIPLIIICGSLFFPAKDVWTHLFDTVLVDYIFNSFALLIGVGFFCLILGVIATLHLDLINAVDIIDLSFPSNIKT